METSKALQSKYRVSTLDNQATASAWTGAVRDRISSVPSFTMQVALVGNISDSFALAQPLLVDLEAINDGSFAASDSLFYIYGTGQNRKEALQDYVVSLCEYYDLLSQQDDELTTRLFNLLQSYLRPTGK